MNPDQEMPVHLHRAITLAEYERDLGLHRVPGWPSPAWSTLRGEVEAELTAGGELWEWEYRSDYGLTGITGLAVVRNGGVARKWQLWKS
ncbi:MAG: hypothetical protein K8U57_01800 [Planctomycetes bacterium]|nr:hypothetical protein [Planctomycetota bacterium]